MHTPLMIIMAYFIHSSSENVPTALTTLYEWMAHGKWTQAEFERENGVIIKEMERANSNVPTNLSTLAITVL